MQGEKYASSRARGEKREHVGPLTKDLVWNVLDLHVIKQFARTWHISLFLFLALGTCLSVFLASKSYETMQHSIGFVFDGYFKRAKTNALHRKSWKKYETKGSHFPWGKVQKKCWCIPGLEKLGVGNAFSRGLSLLLRSTCPLFSVYQER